MKDNIMHFSARISADVVHKFDYIAQYEGRTRNKELEQVMKLYISSFEKKYGEISLDDE